MTLGTEIPPFNYLKGRELVDQLKHTIGVEKDYHLAQKFCIPRNTITTWVSRDLTPYELIIRACHHYKLSVSNFVNDKDKTNQQHKGISSDKCLTAKQIINGKIEDIDPVEFNAVFLYQEAMSKNCVAFIGEKESYIVDTQNIEAISGKYLINIEGVFSINTLQRIPGGKILVGFDGMPVIIASNELTIVGRVVTSIISET